MTKEQYESLPLIELKKLAKARGLRGVSTLRKEGLIQRMLLADAQAEAPGEEMPGAEAEGAAAAPGQVSAATMQEKAPETSKVEEQSQEPEQKRRGRKPAQARAAQPEERREAQPGEAQPEERTVRRRRSVQSAEHTDAAAKLTETPQRAGTAAYGAADASDGTATGMTDGRSAGTTGGQSAGTTGGQSAGTSEGQVAGTSEGRSAGTSAGRSAGTTMGRPAGASSGTTAGTPVRKERWVHKNPTYETNSGTGNHTTYTPRPHTEENGTAESHVQEEGMKKELEAIDSGDEAEGILEIMPDGYGFIRSDNFLPGENDVYVAPSQIRRFHLRTGDIIRGNTRIKTPQEKFSALLYLKYINGKRPSDNAKRMAFEDMTPIFPNERIHLERLGGSISMRIVDLISPIGKGQRGMIVSPPKAGKTTLLKDAARSILRGNPDMHLIILLIDERPEEVTDIKEAIRGDNVEVIYSTFDETPENHKRVSEMVIERAKRLVESKRDVVIFIDSITRLTRAYNQVIPPSGRTLSGGLDPAALHMPKRFFGAARNMREGGSLTILATALVETGSKMDDVVYEEFKGTGNMELVLDRKLQERRIFPAIDIAKSGTRREDLLLSKEEQEAVSIMRKALNGMRSDDATEKILNIFAHTRTNREVIDTIRRHRLL